ncbi:MAG: ribonuclease P protein component [Gemmatimonadota bacterium]
MARPDGPGASGGQRFPSSARITKTAEIRRLFRRGKRKKTSHLDVFHAGSPVSHSRLALVVPKHGRDIVERNRLKRRLREIGRTDILPRLRSRGIAADVLIRARREAYEAVFGELKEELVEVTESLC